jgi:hypothetical protein
MMTPAQYTLWLRLVFAGPASMNPWFRFWLDVMSHQAERPVSKPKKRA